MLFLHLTSLVPLLSYCVAVLANVDTTGLHKLLSPGASISFNATADAPRWSDFHAPAPGVVVNVATEADVAATVRFCVEWHIPFLAQNGAHGWSTTFTLNRFGVLINLAALNAVTFNSQATEVTLQGGAKISDVVKAATAANALVATGTCDCVGALGAILGGGIGNLMGLYGLGVDNIISLNVVDPSGRHITVTPSDTDLWFAFRGAGPNFGIVTSAVLKSYPVGADGLNAWTGPLIFADDQLEPLITAMNDLTIEPEMSLALNLITTGAPNFTPTILLTLFYYGTEAEGKAAFASIYAVGPIVDETAIVPYIDWNAGAAAACVKGGFKPAWGTGLAKLDPATWTTVYNNFKTFVAIPGTGFSAILLDIYSTDKAAKIPNSASAYPFRTSIKYNAIASPTYFDPSQDAVVAAFGFGSRNLWRATSGISGNNTYINNAYGDEPLSTVYGGNVKRLQSIKKKFDPRNVFNQWFPLL